jgi:hypothetical protein
MTTMMTRSAPAMFAAVLLLLAGALTGSAGAVPAPVASDRFASWADQGQVPAASRRGRHAGPRITEKQTRRGAQERRRHAPRSVPVPRPRPGSTAPVGVFMDRAEWQADVRNPPSSRTRESRQREPGARGRVRLGGGATVISAGAPSGCPASRFCACALSLKIHGRIVPHLNLAVNWLGFHRTAASPGMVAVRRGHAFQLLADEGGGVWRVWDANSGGRRTRIHSRSIAGYAIVDPGSPGVRLAALLRTG